MQAGRDINVEGLGLCWLGDVGLAGGEGGKWCIRAVEGEGASIVDRHVNLDRVIEARLEPGSIVSKQRSPHLPGTNPLVFSELLAVELLVFARNVHPQASLPAY